MNSNKTPAARVAGFVGACLTAFAPRSPAGQKLAQWLRSNGAMAGIDYVAATESRGTGTRALSRAAWDRLIAAVAASAETGEEDALARNLRVFGDAVGLDAIERSILGFVLQIGSDWRLGSLCGDLLATRLIDSAGLVGLAAGCPAGEIVPWLRRGKLGALGLVQQNGDTQGRFAFHVPYRIRRALLPPNDGLADIERLLLGRRMPARLETAAFDHVGCERDFLLRLLRGAVGRGQKGVNILLYGPPGTGKTEFCKTIATALGFDLFAVGEADEDGDELCREGRLDALRLAENLARGRERTLLLFDEMEDIQQSGERVGGQDGIRRAGSKVFFNRLLEQNAVPVLWTSNAIDEFDPAFLRRMSFVLELKPLPAAARGRLWQGLAARSGLSLPEEAATALARRYDVAPSVMTSAAEAAALAEGGVEEIELVMQALSRSQRAARLQLPARFTPALVNADTDLAALQAALTRPGAPRDYSLCLYGPPGTGKSEFARSLAESAGLEPLVKRGSDLLSKWLGETEKRIAAAFEQARRDNAFLIIDEAEGFLWSRDGASRSWEVSMVNELLVAMESHPLPFACTTNHLEMIDPAALRRFGFKVKFDALTPEQAMLAYRHFFDRAPPAAAGRIGGLTPGDFAVVARRLRFLDAQDDAAILGLLEQEVAVKSKGLRPIGFNAA